MDKPVTISCVCASVCRIWLRVLPSRKCERRGDVFFNSWLSGDWFRRELQFRLKERL
jgi:hypothetical protein